MTDSEITFVCPHCQREFLVTPAASAALVECPHCHAQVVVADEDGSTEFETDAAEHSTPDRQEELDGLRIRQLSRARRATFRAISYTLIAAVVCGVSVLQCFWECWLSLRMHAILPAIGYVIFAILLALGSIHFAKRTIALRREAATHPEATPETPPDFSTLSDGTQAAKNLENLHL
jgi:hypothetical protein